MLNTMLTVTKQIDQLDELLVKQIDLVSLMEDNLALIVSTVNEIKGGNNNDN